MDPRGDVVPELVGDENREERGGELATTDQSLPRGETRKGSLTLHPRHEHADHGREEQEEVRAPSSSSFGRIAHRRRSSSASASRSAAPRRASTASTRASMRPSSVTTTSDPRFKVGSP